MEMIGLKEEEREFPASVATIGMFDGVHRGHRLLIKTMQEKARELGLDSMVITFDRPPRQVLDETFRPQLLTTLAEKKEAIEAMGVDLMVVLPFTKEMADLSARDFMSRVLRDQLHVRMLVTGYDNRFGKNRTEGFDDYARYGTELGMQVVRGDAELMDDGRQAVSSSVIRELLAKEGKVELMAQYLTRPYQLTGRVMPGEHIGHRLGFPTANLEPDEPAKLIPAPGVYAVRATLEGERQPRAAMMNIGMRPTFEGRRQTLEVNVLGFDGNLYGQAVTVAFVARLREERRFESSEALIRQLQDDRERAEAVLNVNK